jgi:alpha-L-arabinofuranosidase
MASLDAAGDRLFIIAVNDSWSRQVPCEMALAGFASGRIEGIYLSSDDPDASPLVEQQEEVVKPLPVTQADGRLRCTLPAHAAVFIISERKR